LAFLEADLLEQALEFLDLVVGQLPDLNRGVRRVLNSKPLRDKASAVECPRFRAPSRYNPFELPSPKGGERGR
jgi:hypothetical protein